MIKKLFRRLTITFIVFIILACCFDLFSSASTLKFVQLSDTHLSDRGVNTTYKMLASSKDLLNDAIDQINATDSVSFVMVTGDGIDTPIEKSEIWFCEEMKKLKYPWYMTLGNHDISIDGWLTKERFITVLKEKNPNYTFDRSYYTFKPKEGFKVIVLDGVIDYKLTANGNISEQQLRWLNSQLSTVKNEVVLIFLHYPLLEPYSSQTHRIQNADELYTVLNRYKYPIAIFSGHYHAARITREGHILHVSTPALASYPNAFRIVTVSNEKNRVVFDFSFKETNLKELQAEAKIRTFSGSTYTGTENDRNTVVIMDK